MPSGDALSLSLQAGSSLPSAAPEGSDSHQQLTSASFAIPRSVCTSCESYQITQRNIGVLVRGRWWLVVGMVCSIAHFKAVVHIYLPIQSCSAYLYFTYTACTQLPFFLYCRSRVPTPPPPLRNKYDLSTSENSLYSHDSRAKHEHLGIISNQWILKTSLGPDFRRAHQPSTTSSSLSWRDLAFPVLSAMFAPRLRIIAIAPFALVAVGAFASPETNQDQQWIHHSAVRPLSSANHDQLAQPAAPKLKAKTGLSDIISSELIHSTPRPRAATSTSAATTTATTPANALSLSLQARSSLPTTAPEGSDSRPQLIGHVGRDDLAWRERLSASSAIPRSVCTCDQLRMR
jgi:hypothetical protein